MARYKVSRSNDGSFSIMGRLSPGGVTIHVASMVGLTRQELGPAATALANEIEKIRKGRANVQVDAGLPGVTE